MVAESHARMAASLVFGIVVLSACTLWLVVSVTGSFLSSRSQGRLIVERLHSSQYP
jgi:hypothetical protein